MFTPAYRPSLLRLRTNLHVLALWNSLSCALHPQTSNDPTRPCVKHLSTKSNILTPKPLQVSVIQDWEAYTALLHIE